MERAKIAISELRWGVTADQPALVDGTELPIIVEHIVHPAGHYYDVIDGHHRIEGMKAAGERIISCIVVDEDDCADAEFAGGDTPEEEWIERIQNAT